ncbi:MAG: hypothetical protein Q8920_02565 [Bacillota bacterium]|nr:hypothetical protein [Bacillota bacterium]
MWIIVIIAKFVFFYDNIFRYVLRKTMGVIVLPNFMTLSEAKGMVVKMGKLIKITTLAVLLVSVLIMTNHVYASGYEAVQADINGEVNVNLYGANGNNTFDNSTVLNNIITGVGSNNTDLYFPKGIYKISGNITFPDNITLTFEKGAMLSVDNSKTVTINGQINAEMFQVFTGAGAVNGPANNPQIYPQWWGAKGDGSTDDSASLKKTIDSSTVNNTIFISNGSFNLNNNTINITKSLKISGSGILNNAKLYITGTSNVEINGLTTNNVYLSISNSSNIKVLNNKFTNITKDIGGCISLNAGCTDIHIIGNSISNINYITSASVYGCGVKLETSGAVGTVEIDSNNFSNIHGPAAIWIGGGTGLSIDDIKITNNIIQNTENFGIEFFGNNNVIIRAGLIEKNKVWDIGSQRAPGTGVGCGGIYTCGTFASNVDVIGNDVRRVCEVGIEGRWHSVKDNYIEDTGKDQLNYPIGDSAGIYCGGQYVENNIIVNPGANGGIYCYSGDKISNFNYTGNIIRNDYTQWVAATSYSAGDLIVANHKWYICIQAGTSGVSSPNGTGAGISDGSCIWNYKKPFGDNGISLNGVMGLEDITIKDNHGINTPILLLASAFNRNITIVGNTQQCNNYTPVLAYLGGYGSKVCENLVFDRNNTGNMIITNYDFSAFSGSTPDNWSLCNGTITEVVNDSGRTIPQINQIDAKNLGRIKQTVNFLPGLLLAEIRFKSNDGIKVKYFNGVSGAYMGEFSYTDTSGQFIVIGSLINITNTDSIRLEISAKDQTDIAAGNYVAIDYIKVYEK